MMDDQLLEKKCTKCQLSKPLNEFSIKKFKGGKTYQSWCKSCMREYRVERLRQNPTGMREYLKRWRLKNKEHVNEHRKGWAQVRRLEVLGQLGGRCNCCFEKEPRFLMVINAEFQAKRDFRYRDVYEWILRRGKGGTVWCHNCYYAQRAYGTCPHKHQESSQLIHKNEVV